MKTTMELPDRLLDEARRVARRDHTTVRALVEQGLRRVIEDRRRQPAFALPVRSVDGQGMNPDLAAQGWDAIRDLTYEHRGA